MTLLYFGFRYFFTIALL